MFKNNTLKIYIVLFLIGLLLSAIQPKEYFTWFLEVIPALIGFAILALTYKKFAFTNFTYFFILPAAAVLVPISSAGAFSELQNCMASKRFGHSERIQDKSMIK